MLRPASVGHQFRTTVGRTSSIPEFPATAQGLRIEVGALRDHAPLNFERLACVQRRCGDAIHAPARACPRMPFFRLHRTVVALRGRSASFDIARRPRACTGTLVSEFVVRRILYPLRGVRFLSPPHDVSGGEGVYGFLARTTRTLRASLRLAGFHCAHIALERQEPLGHYPMMGGPSLGERCRSWRIGSCGVLCGRALA